MSGRVTGSRFAADNRSADFMLRCDQNAFCRHRSPVAVGGKRNAAIAGFHAEQIVIDNGPLLRTKLIVASGKSRSMNWHRATIPKRYSAA